MNNIEKYIVDGEVQKTKIALDASDGSLSSSDIIELCSDQRIKNAFIGAHYSKRTSKDTWSQSYLDQIVCAAVAESFNQDYLLYLAEVSEYIRSNKKSIIKPILVLLVITITIIIGIVICDMTVKLKVCLSSVIVIISIIIAITIWNSNKKHRKDGEVNDT